MNKSLLVLFSITILFLSVTISPASADILPPKKQASLGIASEDIICGSGMFKVIKESTNAPACIEAKNVLKLVASGWAKPIDEVKLNNLISKISVSSGKINKLMVTPVLSDFGKQSPKVAIKGYDYIFEVCANKNAIVSPEVLIRSDSDTKHFSLVETVAPNSCTISATSIKASDPDSINASLLSKGDVSETILLLSEKVESLKLELANAKQAFGKDNTPENKKEGTKIADLRKQLNDAREDLHRLFFTLYAPEKTKFTVQKLSFSGTPIEGESVKIISISESLSKQGLHDVVFEACAGSKQVRLPVIQITSDLQINNVKLGDKISPNTCQMSSAKIEASDPQNISVKPAGNAESSNQADQLDAKINELQKQLTDEKGVLKEFMHNPKRPENFNELLDSHVSKITELRDKITEAKAELNRILYLTYSHD